MAFILLLTPQFTVIINYLCILDTSLRVLNTWYRLHDITHIQDVHNIVGPLVPYNHACPKRGLIHRDRESSVIRPLLYLQATMAGQVLFNFDCLKSCLKACPIKVYSEMDFEPQYCFSSLIIELNIELSTLIFASILEWNIKINNDIPIKIKPECKCCSTTGTCQGSILGFFHKLYDNWIPTSEWVSLNFGTNLHLKKNSLWSELPCQLQNWVKQPYQ